MSKYGVFVGPYFLVFGLNTGKYGPEKPPYLDSFHVVRVFKEIRIHEKSTKSSRVIKNPSGGVHALTRIHFINLMMKINYTKPV